ncbi:hypothetical protein TNCV_233941 [Trichonephila clavipes]|nr:hypothetical protein TNCV_233941 [Trichonephila clavipes]
MTKGFKKKRSPIPALNGNTGIAYTDDEKAETLADSLENQFQLNDISNPTQDSTHTRLVSRFLNNENNFDDSPTNTKPSEIISIINNFKIRTAPGREGITTKMCKHFNRTSQSTICMFADDTAILAQSNELQLVTHFLHKHIAKLEDWFSTWKIALIVAKTEAVFSYHIRKEPPKLYLHNTHIPWSKNTKYLGLDTLRENCGIIRKQASTDGGVLWKVMCVDVVQVRRKNRSLRDPREARSRVRV